MSEEFGPNFITLTDEDGNDIELEYVDALELDGQTYMAFFPVVEDDADEEAAEEYGLVILKSVMENGEELLHFWYSGILWQGGVPRWCVTVLKESSASGQQAAAQVFREVAQGLLALGEEAAGS